MHLAYGGSMRIGLAFLALFVSLMSYIVLATEFGVNQHYPFIHYILALASLIWMGIETKKQFKVMKVIPNFLGWSLLGLFIWWTASYSNYHQPVTIKKDETVVVEQASLQDHTGKAINFNELVASRDGTLLVFFRGYW